MKICKTCKHRKKDKCDRGAFHCDLTARLIRDMPKDEECVNYRRSIPRIALSVIMLVLGLLFVNGRYHG